MAPTSVDPNAEDHAQSVARQRPLHRARSPHHAAGRRRDRRARRRRGGRRQEPGSQRGHRPAPLPRDGDRRRDGHPGIGPAAARQPGSPAAHRVHLDRAPGPPGAPRRHRGPRRRPPSDPRRRRRRPSGRRIRRAGQPARRHRGRRAGGYPDLGQHRPRADRPALAGRDDRTGRAAAADPRRARRPGRVDRRVPPRRPLRRPDPRHGRRQRPVPPARC